MSRRRGRFRTVSRNLVAKEAPPNREGKISQTFSPYEELGATGLKRSAGYVAEEYVRNLQGQKAALVFREMVDTSAIVGAALYAIKSLIRKAEWKWEAPESDMEQEPKPGDPALDEDGLPIEEPEAKPEKPPFAEDEPPAKKSVRKRRVRKGQPKPEEFMEQVWGDLSASWADTLTEILTFLEQGYSLLEVTYKTREGTERLAEKPGESSKYDDGLIGVRKIALRGQESIVEWIFDEEGGIQGAVQQAAPDYQRVELPVSKLLLFRTTTEKNNPEGRSMLRSAYFEYYIFKRLLELSAIGVERDLAGMPLIKVPAAVLEASDQTVANAYRNIGERVRLDEQGYVMIPSDVTDDTKVPMYDFSLLQGAGAKQLDVKALIERCESRIAMTMLADWLQLGHTEVGARSLGESKVDIFGLALDSTMDSITEVVNRHLVPRLFALNGWPLDKLPRLTHGSVSREDISLTMEALKALTAAGADVFPDTVLTEHLYKMLDWPTEGRDEALAFAEEERERMREAMESGQAVNPITGEPVQPKPGEEPPNTPPGQEPPKPNAFGKVKKSPPWHVEERDGKYVVVVDETGEVVGTHDSKAEAEAQLSALYANAT